jgi:hypothetical protein
MRDDHCDVRADEVRRELRQRVDPPLGGAQHELDVVAVDVAELAQAVAEQLEKTRRIARDEDADPRPHWRLRVQERRPPCQRDGAELSHEVPAVHSITLSARASTPSLR